MNIPNFKQLLEVNVKQLLFPDDTKTLWKYAVAGAVASYILFQQTDLYRTVRNVSYTNIMLLYFTLFMQRRRNVAKIKDKQRRFKEKVDELKLKLADKVTGELITSKRRSILNLDITELCQQLHESLLDPVDVLEAYQVRAPAAGYPFENPRIFLLLFL